MAMSGYEVILAGMLILGLAMVPVVWVMWDPDLHEPTDRRRVAPAQRVVEDMRGSVGITVAKTTGRRVQRPLRVVYVYAARHVRAAWDRPSPFVRRHAATGQRYYETISTYVRKRQSYVPNHEKYVSMEVVRA